MSPVPGRLLVYLKSATKPRGRARLETGEDECEWAFSSAEELASGVADQSDLTAVIGGKSRSETKLAALLAALPFSPRYRWHAADLAYILDQPAPQTLAELTECSQQAAARLAELGPAILAQLAQLVREHEAEARLGCYAAELDRRYDVLRMPAAGDVDPVLYYPPRTGDSSRTRQEVAPDILERVFEAREELAAVFERYEERPQQIEMAQAVEAALAEGQPLVVEAGTGVGKSLAYLLPLAVHAAATGKLCLVSTNTINLQQQLIDLDIPRLQRILDILELQVTLLKGREHYLCIKRLADTLLRNTPATRQRRERFRQAGYPGLLFMLRLLIQCAAPQGDLDTVPAPPGLSQVERLRLLSTLDCRFTTCLGERCEHKSNCHFFAQRAAAMNSHLVVTNHALVFSLYRPDAEDADNIVTRASAIVFDEAHNLESAITNQHTLIVNNAMPVDLGNRLLEVLQQEDCRRRLTIAPEHVDEVARETFSRVLEQFGDVPDWIKAAVEVREQVSNLLAQAAEKGHVALAYSTQLTPATATPGQMQVLELLAKLAARLLSVIERYYGLTADLRLLFGTEESSLYIDDDMFQMDLQSLVLDLTDARMALANWQPGDPGLITWFNSELGAAELAWEYKTAPLHVGPVIQPLLIAKECVILCGATLTVSDRFDYLQQSLGFEPEMVGFTHWLKLTSPFDYARQSLMLIATDLATPTGETREQYLEQLQDVVVGVSRLFSRGVLVLFNSWRDLTHLAERLPEKIDAERILAQGTSGSREQIADRFRREGDKVLLATRSFWEGFDVAGEALTCVVLAKLPFANFKDPIHAGRQRAIEAEGGDSFRQYSLPLAAMQLKQGFGRLIRSTQDYGCVFLLDSRAARANYGRVFLDSLPSPQLVTGSYQECLDAAREFMEVRDAK